MPSSTGSNVHAFAEKSLCQETMSKSAVANSASTISWSLLNTFTIAVEENSELF